MRRSFVAGLLATLAMTASAWSQDYTVSPASGRLETRPAAGVLSLGQSNTNGAAGLTIDLPFEFPYYGRVLTRLFVSPSGFVIGNPQFTTIFANPTLTGAAPGRDAQTTAFPYSPNGVNGSASTIADGLIAPLWDALDLNPGVPTDPNTGDTYWWVTGAAGTRHFVVSWENFRVGQPVNPRIRMQLHLFEGTGRIVFAYDPTAAGYVSARFVCGIDSYGDARFTCPLAPTTQNTGYPGSDFLIDPRTVTYTGRVLYDKVVSDATGIGNSTLPNQPLRGTRVELRRDSGILANAVLAGADGSFSIAGLGVAAASTGTMHVLPRNQAVVVAASIGGAPPAWIANGSLSYGSGANFGTMTLGSAADGSGALRASFNVAGTCLAAWEYAIARTTDAIPRLDVVADATVSIPTIYLKAATSPASMSVAGAASPNPDVWDDAIVTRTYARHVLASIASTQTTAPDARFDAVTDPQNAFAEAFGCLVWASVSGTLKAIDGKGASSAVVYDLESPSISVARGDGVAGCVAGALFDLADAANETADRVDGTIVPDRVFQRVDAFGVAPTASTFLQSWVDAGYDAASITRVFVGNGALADDALEPNDAPDEAPSIGTAGARRSSLVLNRYSEDWTSVTLAAPAASFLAEVVYDRISVDTSIALELRDAGGALVASGTPIGTTGPIRATAVSLPAGVYRLGVRHLSGAAIPSYTLQAYEPLAMETAPLSDWTVGRPYDEPLGIAGGVPPYTLSTLSASLPPGLSFSPLTQHVVGAPTDLGTFGVTIELRDDAFPPNIVTRTQTVTFRAPLEIGVASFVGFPAGRAIDASLPVSGGTPPLLFTFSGGTLPAGLALDAGSLRVTGTSSPADSGALLLDGVDAAGSASHVVTRAVVAVALDRRGVPAELAAGDAAAGWWFDAVQGSAVAFVAKPAKRRAKRALTGAVVAPDRSLVETKVTGKRGGLAVSKFIAPQSGRYFVVAAGETGDATQLLGSVSLSAPKRGRAVLAEFDQRDTTDVAVGLLPGARLTLKFAGDAKTGLTAKVVGLRDPSGTPVSFASFVTTSGTGGTLTGEFATGGTWTVVLGAASLSGVPAKLSWSYAIAQPKGASYSAD